MTNTGKTMIRTVTTLHAHHLPHHRHMRPPCSGIRPPTTIFKWKMVKTGDVTWACLKDRGAYIGCNTVEECK